MRQTSESGWTTPVSLFAHITEVKPGRESSTAAAERRQIEAGIPVHASPLHLEPHGGHGLDGTQDRAVLDRADRDLGMGAPHFAESALRALLFASVPPAVNTISSGFAPMRAATSPRACSTASRTRVALR